MSSTSSPHARRLWTNGNFLLLLSGQLASSVGDQLQSLALPLLVLAITGSAIQAGLVLGFHTAAYLIFGIFAGAVADRRDRRSLMVCCEIGQVVLSLSIPLALWLHLLDSPQLYLVSIASGALATIYQSANSASLPNVVGRRQLPAALSAQQASFSAIGIVGASLAGLAYTVGRAVPFLANAASFALSAISLLFIRVDFQQQAPERAAGLRDQLVEGVKWVWDHRLIRFLVFVKAADNLRYGAGYLLIIVIARHVGASSFEIGAIFSGAALGTLLGAACAPYLVGRFPMGRIAIVMLWSEAIAFPFYAIVPDALLLGLVALFESIVAPIYVTAMNSHRLILTADSMRGRVEGAVSTLTTGAISIGAILGGYLLSAIGSTWLVVGCALWIASLAAVATLRRDVRSARSPIEASVMTDRTDSESPGPSS